MNQKEIIAVFDSDQKLVDAVKRLKGKGIPITEAYTPFPVHDVLKLLGRETRLPYLSVIAGASTIILVFFFLYYITVIDYPIKYGGKPSFAFPSYVVIIYLGTILLTFISTVIGFQMRTRLYQGKEPEVFYPGSTDDKFIIAIGGAGGLNEHNLADANAIIKEIGASEIIERDVTL
jgi:hypothetical protein